MKLSWTTDTHLNLIEHDARTLFYDAIIATDCDAVLLTGDIAESPSLVDLLIELANHIQKPIYFILGNHDYYYSNVADMRAVMSDLTKAQKHLFWLPASGAQVLNDSTVLLGQDGWADGRCGDYENTQINLNDSRRIDDLFQKNILGKYRLLEKMQELADADALALHDELAIVIEKYKPKKIIILTHVPPFKELCFNKGKPMQPNYLPYFVSQATGDVLLDVANKHKDISFLVLCGHTHERAHYQALGNLETRVGRAEYGLPAVEDVIAVFSKG